ncbi:hypothetical protein CDL15_Pgr023551 [Punica granatum]|uniref:Uncharacterized protein n=1 Tax=Punica granatum TaxID=22663 RepID=A0A218W7H4_PUNGR|nr:hypothetical protein CDL15_Pgr023551 [Punica granatum]
MALKNTFNAPQGSQSSPVEREGPQAQSKCGELPEKFQKDKRKNGGLRLEGPSLRKGDSIVPLKVEMTVEEFNKLIEN